MVEPGGQLFHPFRDGLDYAFILPCSRTATDAGRVIRGWQSPWILGSARPLPGRPIHESLQGRASWPRPTPRRCHVATATAGFTE